jgi:uncharacterized membrane protein
VVEKPEEIEMKNSQNLVLVLKEQIKSVLRATVHPFHLQRYSKDEKPSLYFTKRFFCSGSLIRKKQKDKVANNYWSSTTYAPNTTNAWNVNFNNGNVNNNNKTNNNYVRCVSGA